MTAPRGASFILFVAGEPDTVPEPLRDVGAAVFGRFAGVMMGEAVVGPPNEKTHFETVREPPPEGQEPWHLSREQNQAVQLVQDIAARLHTTLVVVDVNRAGDRRDLVERWVGTDDLLPLLVRSDGSRLEGLEQFLPELVRSFLRGPKETRRARR